MYLYAFWRLVCCFLGVAMLLYCALVVNLSILSMRISSFVMVCGAVLSEVGLFLTLSSERTDGLSRNIHQSCQIKIQFLWSWSVETQIFLLWLLSLRISGWRPAFWLSPLLWGFVRSRIRALDFKAVLGSVRDLLREQSHTISRENLWVAAFFQNELESESAKICGLGVEVPARSWQRRLLPVCHYARALPIRRTWCNAGEVHVRWWVNRFGWIITWNSSTASLAIRLFVRAQEHVGIIITVSIFVIFIAIFLLHLGV